MISAEQTLAVPVNSDDHTQGPKNAPATLVEYGDYECPYCGQAQSVIKSLQEEFGDQLRFCFRNFPLTQMHPYAYGAAEAAEAAGAQGKFWEMHDLLYSHQDALDEQHLLQYAQHLNLDMDRFRKALQQDTFGAKIRRDVESGLQSGVRGTPTFFVNGRGFSGQPTPAGLGRALRRAAGA